MDHLVQILLLKHIIKLVLGLLESGLSLVLLLASVGCFVDTDVLAQLILDSHLFQVILSAEQVRPLVLWLGFGLWVSSHAEWMLSCEADYI